MQDLLKVKHAAGGFSFTTTDKKGNTRYGEEKKASILIALKENHTEGVYLTTNNDIKRQLLNGSSQILNSKNIWG